jgi:thioredoxin-like negative regulator of GroEL
VLRLDPDNWDAMLELGMTFVSLGRPDDARRYLGDLLRRNSGHSGSGEAERILAGR